MSIFFGGRAAEKFPERCEILISSDKNTTSSHGKKKRYLTQTPVLKYIG